MCFYSERFVTEASIRFIIYMRLYKFAFVKRLMTMSYLCVLCDSLQMEDADAEIIEFCYQIRTLISSFIDFEEKNP